MRSCSFQRSISNRLHPVAIEFSRLPITASRMGVHDTAKRAAAEAAPVDVPLWPGCHSLSMKEIPVDSRAKKSTLESTSNRARGVRGRGPHLQCFGAQGDAQWTRNPRT